jgi:hypothetical protein
MKFEDLSDAQLKRVIKNYRLHLLKELTGYTKMSREDLINLCKKLFDIDDKKIKPKITEPIFFDIPKGKHPKAEKMNKVITKKEKKPEPAPKQTITLPMPEPSKVKQNSIPEKHEKKQEKKEDLVFGDVNESEDDFIVNNWNDTFLGYIIDSTKYGQYIENLIVKKNKKGAYIDDYGLLSFIRPLNNKIVEKWGVDRLFEGIDKLAKHYDAEKYGPQFGKIKFLPVRDFFNVKNLKTVQKRNSELYEKYSKNK